MPDTPIKVFNFQHGINVSRSSLQRTPGEFVFLQNGQPSYVFGLGGVEKRGGLAPLNSATALAGPIMALSSVPLSSLFDAPGLQGIFVSLDPGAAAPFWRYSADGVTFTAGATGLDAVPGMQTLTSQWAAWSATALYFIDNATGNLCAYDGATVTVLKAQGAWPSVGGSTTLLYHTIAVYSGSVYVTCTQPDGFGYVVQCVIATGAASVLGGASFNGGSAALLSLASVISAAGVMYVAAVAPTFLSHGQMFAYNIAAPAGWVTEATLPGNGGTAPTIPRVLVEYSGEIYVGTSADTFGGGPGNALILARGGGTWTTVSQSFTPDDAWIAVCAMAVFDGNLYAHFAATNDALAQVWQFNGAAWALDEDLVASFGANPDNSQFHHMAALGTTALILTLQNQSVYRRSAAGAWTEPLVVGIGFEGIIGKVGV